MTSTLNNTVNKPQNPPKPKRRFTFTGILIGVGVALAVLLVGILIVRAGVPTQVYSLNAKAISYSQINLTWTCPATDEQGFHIKRSLASSGPWEQVGEAGVDATSYQDTGLKGYTAYYYKVLPYNIYGESTSSSYAFTTTLDGPPYNLSAQGVAYDKINLTWSNQANTNSGNYSQIKLYRTGGSGDYNQSADASPGSYPDNIYLLPSTTYTYRLCAFNSYAGKEICADQQVSATTLATPPPPPTPANFTASVYETNKIKLTWDDVAGESSYQIWAGGTPDNLGILTYKPANATSYIYTYTLKEGDTRYFALKACHDVYGCSAPTETVSATIPINPPTNLTATAATDSLKINLAWQDHTTIETNYIVEKSPGDDQHFTILATLPANTVTYTDTTDLVADTTYYYKVRGKLNDTTFTAYTNTVSTTPTYKYTGINPGWVGMTPAMGPTLSYGGLTFSSDGQYAYVVSETGLQIINIFDASQPKIISHIQMTYPSCVETDNNGFLFVGARKDGQYVINVIKITDPINPYIYSQINLSNYAGDIVYLDNTLYVVSPALKGLTIIDVTSRLNPQTDSFIATNGESHKIYVQNNLAFIADGYNGLVVIDISNHEIVGHYRDSAFDNNNAISITVINNIAYLGLVNKLYVLDCNNVASIKKIHEVEINGAAADIKASETDNYLYILTGGSTIQNGFVILRIDSPTIINQISQTIIRSGVHKDLALHNNTFGTVSNYGLILYDTTSPESPSLLKELEAITIVRNIQTKDNYLYALTEYTLYCYDISDSTKPVMISSLGGFSAGMGIAIGVNGYLYISDSNTIKVVDITNRQNPYVAAVHSLPDDAYGLTISGNYLYVANFLAGLTVVKLNTPTSLQTVKTVDTSGYPYMVVVRGDYAYIADSYAGMVIIDIKNPDLAHIVSEIDTSSTYRNLDIALKGDYAFLAGEGGDITVINIKNPLLPFKYKDINIDGSVVSVSVSPTKPLLFAGRATGVLNKNGIQVIDISNLDNPVIVNIFNPTDVKVYSIINKNQFVYASSNDRLVEVYDLYYDYLKVEQATSCGGGAECRSANHGQEITYTLKITNPTPYTFTGSNNILTNAIPDGTTYVERSVTGGGQYGSGKITWNLGQVNPNEEREVTFKVNVD